METIYQEPVEFIEENLSGCRQQVLWMKGETKSQIEQLLDHPFPGVRVRYCEKDGKTAWVLDEIVNTELITSWIILDHVRVD